MSSIGTGEIICISPLRCTDNVGISVKPVLKLIALAAAGAILAKRGTASIQGQPFNGRSFGLDCAERHVNCCD